MHYGASMEHWSKDLKRLGIACHEPINWAGTMPDPQTAWAKCDNPGWMLRVAGKLCGKRGSARHRRVVLATCACVRLVLRCVPRGEERPRRAIELAEAWARQKPGVNLRMIHAAAEAADAADAASGAAYAAADAAYAAADAADAADAARAAYAAAAAAEASANAAYITYAAYDDAAAAAEYTGINLEEFRESCLRIIRRMLPDVPDWFKQWRESGVVQ